jgi:hypothetical protein
MNPEVKALWVADLRSNKYKQVKKTLNCINGFCCLGRLTDLYRQSPANTENLQWEQLADPFLDPSGVRVFGKYREDLILPEEVKEWAGLHDNNVSIDPMPRLDDNLGELHTTLSGANDGGYTFEQIADIIEEQL